MKRQKNGDDIISRVYAYGCGHPISGLQAAYEEQQRNVLLWDKLVELDELHDVSILAAASADDPRLVELREEIYHIGRTFSDAIEIRKRERKMLRGNSIAAELDANVALWSGKRKVARKEFFEHLGAWKKAHPEAIDEFTARRFANIAIARNASGLYWGNYNRVIQSFEVARGLCRKIGRRLRRSDSARTDGCLTVQIQRTASGLGAAPKELQDGSLSMIQISRVSEVAYDKTTPRGERLRLCQTILEMRVDAVGNMIRMPVWIHRPLPENCRVKSAQLTWRDSGARGRKWQVALSISMPRIEIEIVHPNPRIAVGVDVGWRLKPDGSLRVAYWHSSAGEHGEFVLPKAWMDHQDWIERTRSEIDSEIITGETDVRKAKLKIKGGRGKDLGQRRELYRLFAHNLVQRYGLIGIEDLDLAGMAIKREDDEYAGRAMRQRAAIHTLLAEIKHQAAKHGARIVMCGGPSTMQCHACGKIVDPAHRERLIWTCDGCGNIWDQDDNGAINLLVAAQIASGQVTEKPEMPKNKVLEASPDRKKRGARKSPAGISGINASE